MSFRRRNDRRGQPAIPQPLPPPAPANPAHHTHPTALTNRHNLAESALLATTPMPYDVAADHEPVIVFAAGYRPLADLGADPGRLLATVLENIAREASERGCDAVYSIQHTLAVDNGWIYITATGTGSRPITNMDGPPIGP